MFKDGLALRQLWEGKGMLVDHRACRGDPLAFAPKGAAVADGDRGGGSGGGCCGTETKNGHQDTRRR